MTSANSETKIFWRGTGKRLSNSAKTSPVAGSSMGILDQGQSSAAI
jgi:hypothetical protein